ncbi:MAG: hypothetical protein ACLQAT_19900, partial [Candidatus Binataceae bacterium]
EKTFDEYIPPAAPIATGSRVSLEKFPRGVVLNFSLETLASARAIYSPVSLLGEWSPAVLKT